MYPFLFTFAIGLIALYAGVSLYLKSLEGGSGRYLARFFGFIIMVLALCDIVSTVRLGIKQWLYNEYVTAPMSPMQA